MLRLRLLLLCLVSVLAAACGDVSHVSANATIHVRGHVLAPSGAGLAQRPVRLGAGIPNDDATLAVLSLGLACTSGLCTGKVLDTSTSAAGTYSFTLKGKDTQGSFGKAKSELVTASAAPTDTQVSGASASARFEVQTDQVTLPTLKLVDPRLALTSKGSLLHSTWATHRSGPYALSFETSSSVPVWQATTTGQALDVDSRVLEGSSGRAVLSGGSTDSIEGSSVALSWRSPGIGYAASPQVPVSRGAACVLTASGASVREPAPCGLTDGDLSDAANLTDLDSICTKGPATPTCLGAKDVTIELPSAEPADLVLVRGCSATCPVSTSVDGTTFRPLGVIGADYGSLRLRGTPIRAVRLGLGTSGDTLREVSVWTPTTAPALRAVTPETLHRLQGPYVGGTRATHRRWVTGLAAALVLVLVAGLAFALGRRRSSTT